MFRLPAALALAFVLTACGSSSTPEPGIDPEPAKVESPKPAKAKGKAKLTAEQLLQHYCRQVYDHCGSYEQTAQRLQLDRRTVKRKAPTALP